MSTASWLLSQWLLWGDVEQALTPREGVTEKAFFLFPSLEVIEENVNPGTKYSARWPKYASGNIG